MARARRALQTALRVICPRAASCSGARRHKPRQGDWLLVAPQRVTSRRHGRGHGTLVSHSTDVGCISRGDVSEETTFSWDYLAIDGDIRQCWTRARPYRSHCERQPMANERYRPQSWCRRRSHAKVQSARFAGMRSPLSLSAQGIGLLPSPARKEYATALIFQGLAMKAAIIAGCVVLSVSFGASGAHAQYCSSGSSWAINAYRARTHYCERRAVTVRQHIQNWWQEHDKQRARLGLPKDH